MRSASGAFLIRRRSRRPSPATRTYLPVCCTLFQVLGQASKGVNIPRGQAPSSTATAILLSNCMVTVFFLSLRYAHAEETAAALKSTSQVLALTIFDLFWGTHPRVRAVRWMCPASPEVPQCQFPIHMRSKKAPNIFINAHFFGALRLSASKRALRRK